MDKQSLIAKYGKKFVSTSAETPVLMGVHYAADGTAYATNRHYGLRIKNAHMFGQALTLDVKKGAPLEGTFPDMSRLFPSSCASDLFIPMGGALDSAVIGAAGAAAVAAVIDKKWPLVRIEARNGSTFLVVRNEKHSISYSVNIGNSNHDSIRSLNATYLLTALQLFKDADRDVTILFNAPMSPIILTDGADISVIILPYRTTG